MDFAQPRWLWLLAALPILSAATVIASRRRSDGWRAIAFPGRPPADGGVAWSLAMALIVLALAQPRWGRGSGADLPPGRDLVLLIDASWSMAAEDVVPDRLGRAVAAAEQLTRAIGRDPGDRVAVVAFAGRGVIRCPLTTNLGAVIETLHSLRPGGVEPGGSDLGAGLDAAMDALTDEPRAGGRIVVIFSDGEDHTPSWADRVDRLRAFGVVVHAVAIGDAERGHPIPIEQDGKGGRRFLTVHGDAIESSRVDLELRGLALATDGAFVPLGIASADLAELYDHRIRPSERRARERTLSPERPERYGAFVLASLAVGLIGSWPRGRPAAKARPWWTTWILLGAASGSMIGAGGTRLETPAEAVAKGRVAFDRGDLASALDAFVRAESSSPEDPVPAYNAAATLYQLGRFDEARDRYLFARERADARMTVKIDYALGNTAVALRDIPSALVHYDECLRSIVPGSPYDRVRGFARENRTFAERLANLGGASTEGETLDASEDGRDEGGRGPGDGGESGVEEPDGGAESRSGPSRPESSAAEGGGAGSADSENSAAVPGSGISSGRSPGQESPTDRLSRAIESIRNARDRRFSDLPPAPSDSSGRPRW